MSMSRTDVRMTIGADVARRGESQLLALEGGARGDAGHGLQRLEAGAREDQRVGVAVARDDLAVGGQHDGRARMAGLDEAASFHDGEFDGILNGESLQHRTQPTVGARRAPRSAPQRVRRRTWRVADWRHGSIDPSALGEHRYALTSTWTGNTGTGTSGYRDYRRDVTIEVEGKPELLASADKPFRGDPARWNPEDLLLASLSECHLLSYLHACVTAGVVVVSYRDRRPGSCGGRRGRRRLRRGGAAAGGGGGRGVDGRGRGARPRAGERVVLHRELDELPRASRGDGPTAQA